ncbi:MAG: DUF1127 domain-containing protein [Pseudomonadota bacterium]
MTTAFFDATDIPVERARPTSPRTHLSRELRYLLARKDDRLLRDIGLTREEILGPEETFRAEWRRMRDTWNL